MIRSRITNGGCFITNADCDNPRAIKSKNILERFNNSPYRPIRFALCSLNAFRIGYVWKSLSRYDKIWPLKIPPHARHWMVGYQSDDAVNIIDLYFWDICTGSSPSAVSSLLSIIFINRSVYFRSQGSYWRNRFSSILTSSFVYEIFRKISRINSKSELCGVTRWQHWKTLFDSWQNLVGIVFQLRQLGRR